MARKKSKNVVKISEETAVLKEAGQDIEGFYPNYPSENGFHYIYNVVIR